MRTPNKTQQIEQPTLIIDPALDAQFAGKELFPHKIQKLRKLYDKKASKPK